MHGFRKRRGERLGASTWRNLEREDRNMGGVGTCIKGVTGLGWRGEQEGSSGYGSERALMSSLTVVARNESDSLVKKGGKAKGGKNRLWLGKRIITGSGPLSTKGGGGRSSTSSRAFYLRKGGTNQ